MRIRCNFLIGGADWAGAFDTAAFFVLATTVLLTDWELPLAFFVAATGALAVIFLAGAAAFFVAGFAVAFATGFAAFVALPFANLLAVAAGLADFFVAGFAETEALAVAKGLRFAALFALVSAPLLFFACTALAMCGSTEG